MCVGTVSRDFPAFCLFWTFASKILKLYAVRANIYNMGKLKELEQLKEESGLSWRKFAESFGIPYRTLQDWHLGNRPMPEYILRLMVYKVETEKLLRESKIDKGGDSV